jgi:hypothetical protein
MWNILPITTWQAIEGITAGLNEESNPVLMLMKHKK